jgi:hypothetical protein
MAQKQVVRRVVLVLTIVLGGLCGAQSQEDLKAVRSAQPTKALDQLPSEKAKVKASPAVGPTTAVKVLTKGPRIIGPVGMPSKALRMSPDMMARLQSAVKQVDWGTLTYPPPASMQGGQEQTIAVTFSRTVSPDELRKKLAEIIGTVKPDQIDVANMVKADLGSGKAFLINLVSSSEQPVVGTQKGLWKWIVTANEPGLHPLSLEVSSRVLVDGEWLVCGIQEDELTVDVTAAPPVPIYEKVVDFLIGHWEWFWTAIPVPIAGVLWKLYRKKKKASKQSKPRVTEDRENTTDTHP